MLVRAFAKVAPGSHQNTGTASAPTQAKPAIHAGRIGAPNKTMHGMHKWCRNCKTDGNWISLAIGYWALGIGYWLLGLSLARAEHVGRL